MDKLKFARLSVHDINEIENFIMPSKTFETEKVTCEAVDELLKTMAGGTNKIDAIREYRSLTGAGLKEDKDAIERYWISKSA